MQKLLEKFLSPGALSSVDYDQAFNALFENKLNESQVAALLAAMRVKADKTMALISGSKIMRANAISPELSTAAREGLIDNCGTGGDGLNTFNISTGSAIIAASLGAKLAKHGNRSVSSKCGSADLLFAAGYPDTLSETATANLLETTGFGFFFAPAFHPKMKPLMPTRKALGIKTIFNFLGPLVNPINPEYQLLGVGHKNYHKPVAEALKDLGIKRAAVVHSKDGLDEFSPAALTDVYFIENGVIEEHTIDPAKYITPVTIEQIAGGDVEDNLAILHDLLDGKDIPVKQAIILNAGACLWVCGKAESLEVGCEQAKHAIESGMAKTYFEKWISTAKSMAKK
jgi:anthranilate phosphoribosyltransferase